MPAGDANSSGHLVPSLLGLACVLLVETNPFPNLYSSRLCSSNIPRYFLDFALSVLIGGAFIGHHLFLMFYNTDILQSLIQGSLMKVTMRTVRFILFTLIENKNIHKSLRIHVFNFNSRCWSTHTVSRASNFPYIIFI